MNNILFIFFIFNYLYYGQIIDILTFLQKIDKFQLQLAAY